MNSETITTLEKILRKISLSLKQYFGKTREHCNVSEHHDKTGKYSNSPVTFVTHEGFAALWGKLNGNYQWRMQTFS